MRLVRTIRETRRLISAQRLRGRTIGLVPTMGYLHEGHLSLVRLARRHAKFVVVSIFVNPTQFGPAEDLVRYPRDLARDLRLLEAAGCDLVFFPSVRTMYPDGYRTYADVTGFDAVLCGASRPGHFRGVATVVLKLFNIVKPDIAVFGRKDFQQTMVIRRMAADLDLDPKIVIAPTVRDKSGLAKSSRNKYLNDRERGQAAVLYRSLRRARQAVRTGRLRDPKTLVAEMERMIRESGGRIDYVAVVSPVDLQPVKRLRRGQIALVAVFFGKTRLIDNITL